MLSSLFTTIGAAALPLWPQPSLPTCGGLWCDEGFPIPVGRHATGPGLDAAGLYLRYCKRVFYYLDWLNTNVIKVLQENDIKLF